MSEAKVYLFHELSSYLPLLEGEEFDDLVEDIRQHGQIEPATLFEGKILDGRNRYRACKILKRDLITREWKPSKATGSTPLQYVISENIMRRHLSMAQKGEIGMLLYDEIEKQVKEEKAKKISETMKEKFRKGELEGKKGEGKGGIVSLSANEIKDSKKYKKEDTTAYKVAKKVRVKPMTIKKVKKIRDTAYDKETGEIKDKSIAEKWEDAKRGESSVDAVYKKVQEREFVKSLEESEPEVKKAVENKVITPKEAKEVIDLPDELKKAVIKPKSKITIKEAKEVAKLPKDIITEVAKEKISVDDAKDIADMKPEVRKEAIKHITKEKELHKDTIKHITNVAKGITPPPTKIIDIDQKVINQFIAIKKQIIIKMSRKHVESYNEATQSELIRIMKECLEYLQKELNIKGIINV